MSPPSDVRVDVQGLRIVLAGGSADVVDDVSFQVRSGELLGLVGESGSGKTTVALALLGHDPPALHAEQFGGLHEVPFGYVEGRGAHHPGDLRGV